MEKSRKIKQALYNIETTDDSNTHKALMLNSIEERPRISRMDTDKKEHPKHWQYFAKAMCRKNSKKEGIESKVRTFVEPPFPTI